MRRRAVCRSAAGPCRRGSRCSARACDRRVRRSSCRACRRVPNASFEPKCGLPVLQLSATNRSLPSASALPSNRPRMQRRRRAPCRTASSRSGRGTGSRLKRGCGRTSSRPPCPVAQTSGTPRDRLRLERALADDAQPAGPLGDEHVAVRQEGEAPRVRQPLATGTTRYLVPLSSNSCAVAGNGSVGHACETAGRQLLAAPERWWSRR